MAAVTIGMPVYNGEAFLESSLACVLGQTFDDFEVVISENASTDATPRIVAEAARDPRVRVIAQDRTIAQLENYGAVLDAASSPYFLWRACDDWSDPNYVEALYRAIDMGAGAKLAVSQTAHADFDGNELHRAPAPVGIDAKTRLARVITLMRGVQAGWFFGLYETESLKNCFRDVMANYPHVWGWDHLIILPFLMNDRLVATEDTVMVQRNTGVSDSNFRPADAASQRRMARSFLSNTLTVWRDSRLTAFEKAACLPYLPIYASGKTEKYRRIAKNTLLEFTGLSAGDHREKSR